MMQNNIWLDTRCLIDLGLVYSKGRVGIYESVRVDTVANQANKPKISEGMESWSNDLNHCQTKRESMGVYLRILS